jgi:branched-chain amino acid transport system permease protein
MPANEEAVHLSGVLGYFIAMSVQRKSAGWTHRLPLRLPAVAAFLALGACANTEPHRIETCTRVVNGIHVGADAIDIVSTAVDPRTDDVRVNYRIRSGAQATGRVQWVVCHFEEPELGDPEPDLVSVDTSEGPLGDGRLFVLKRWWLHQEVAAWHID